MSKKTVCEIPPHWKLADWLEHSCTDRSHRHITTTKAAECVADGAAEWIAPPSDRRRQKIVRTIARNVPIRGVSSIVGSYLALAVVAKEQWAVAMFRSIRMRRE